MSDLNGKSYAPRPGHIPGVAINLGGIDLVLAPLGLRLMREFETKAKDLAAKTDPPPTPEDYYELNLGAILESLHRNYPEITRDELDALLDSENLKEAIAAVLNQSGLKRVKPGETQPVK